MRSSCVPERQSSYRSLYEAARRSSQWTAWTPRLVPRFPDQAKNRNDIVRIAPYIYVVTWCTCNESSSAGSSSREGRVGGRPFVCHVEWDFGPNYRRDLRRINSKTTKQQRTLWSASRKRSVSKAFPNASFVGGLTNGNWPISATPINFNCNITWQKK